ncbi:MAG: insulinase family protein [Betaproteobacteria bacterium]|nr:insulinase family protein [Betaproteobacteria bacterium]
MRIILLILACLFGSASHAGVDIQRWTTPSGARVLFVASPVLPMLDVQVDFAAGSLFVPDEKAGLAGLTVGLLDSGARIGATMLDEEQIAERFADVGARLTSSVDHDRASVRLRTLSSAAERAASLEFFRAVLAAPSFPEDALTREKARHIAAIQEADTQPDGIGSKRFARAMYPDHPYGVNATADSIARIVRADLEAFWRTHYLARHAVVSIIGAVTRAEAEAIADQLTEALPQATHAAPALKAVTLPQRQALRMPHPATQSHIFIGMPSVQRNDPDFFPLLVGNYVLGGGGFVSRLMQEVREKRGYAYSVRSTIAPRLLPGPFEISLQTKRSQSGDAIKLVETLLRDFLRDGPSAKELQAAKQNLIDGQALRLDSNAKILGFLSLIGFYDLPLNYLDEYPRRIEAVTARQVRDAFARHVRPEHLVTVVVAAD